MPDSERSSLTASGAPGSKCLNTCIFISNFKRSRNKSFVVSDFFYRRPGPRLGRRVIRPRTAAGRPDKRHARRPPCPVVPQCAGPEPANRHRAATRRPPLCCPAASWPSRPAPRSQHAVADFEEGVRPARSSDGREPGPPGALIGRLR